jgi:UDP-3-O-[3-hydroxymyristoyl] glucosamine N-acyltransferase
LPPVLDVVYATWRAIDAGVERVEVSQHPDYSFDERSLQLPPGASVIVAVDRRFLNFKRLELASLLVARGHQLATVVARSASIGDAAIGTGSFIGEGAVIGPGTTIGECACIGARAVVGANAKIGRGAWIDPGVIVGNGVQLGDQCSVASGVVIADGAEIGALCVLGIPQLVAGPLPARTFFHPAFHEPIRVFGGD